MTTETRWYCSYIDGKPPTLRRLCRLPIDTQWEAAIDIAIAYASGDAGYRNVGKSYIGEITWFVLGWAPEARSKNASTSTWWLIPSRVDRRVFAIYDQAVESVLRSDRGVASGERVLACLQRWKKSGSWRKVASKVFPKTGFPSEQKKKAGRKK